MSRDVSQCEVMCAGLSERVNRSSDASIVRARSAKRSDSERSSPLDAGPARSTRPVPAASTELNGAGFTKSTESQRTVASLNPTSTSATRNKWCVYASSQVRIGVRIQTERRRVISDTAVALNNWLMPVADLTWQLLCILFDTRIRREISNFVFYLCKKITKYKASIIQRNFRNDALLWK